MRLCVNSSPTLKTSGFSFRQEHKDSSAAFSKSIEIESFEDFDKAEKEFENEIPFCRFYTEHEFLSGDEVLADQCTLEE